MQAKFHVLENHKFYPEHHLQGYSIFLLILLTSHQIMEQYVWSMLVYLVLFETLYLIGSKEG